MDPRSIYKPTFSVIIPTYNRAQKLLVCLDSLLKQTYKDFEVIVCDDGSSDCTVNVVRKFERLGLNIIYFFNENWGGPARPRNVGIINAKAEWICFLDSDDFWYPNKLEKCINYIKDYDIICHHFDIVKCFRGKRFLKTYPFKGNVFKILMTRGNSITTSSVCVRRDILMSINGFSEDRRLIAVEDFDLWLRIALGGYKFKVINERLGAYSMGDQNISSFDDKQIERLKMVYDQYLFLFNNDKKSLNRSIGILSYQLGRIKHIMSEYQEAVNYYRKAIILGNKLTKFKASLFFLFALLRIQSLGLSKLGISAKSD